MVDSTKGTVIFNNGRTIYTPENNQSTGIDILKPYSPLSEYKHEESQRISDPDEVFITIKDKDTRLVRTNSFSERTPLTTANNTPNISPTQTPRRSKSLIPRLPSLIKNGILEETHKSYDSIPTVSDTASRISNTESSLEFIEDNSSISSKTSSSKSSLDYSEVSNKSSELTAENLSKLQESLNKTDHQSDQPSESRSSSSSSTSLRDIVEVTSNPDSPNPQKLSKELLDQAQEIASNKISTSSQNDHTVSASNTPRSQSSDNSRSR